MGTKANPGEFDCYAAAEDDEPMFILLASDLLAPMLVEEWVARKMLVSGASKKTEEAIQCAADMRKWKMNHA